MTALLFRWMHLGGTCEELADDEAVWDLVIGSGSRRAAERTSADPSPPPQPAPKPLAVVR
jgi:hypothetical protein